MQTLETDTDADLSPTERGETVVEELAERAGIEYMSYNAEVKVAEDTEQAIIEAAKEYDTVCVGATRSGPISQAVFGSLPEKVGARSGSDRCDGPRARGITDVSSPSPVAEISRTSMNAWQTVIQGQSDILSDEGGRGRTQAPWYLFTY